MDIKIPSGFDHIKDEGILMFLGFIQRVSERYGYNEWYTLSKEDCAIICNKNGVALIKWLHRHDLPGLEIGDPYSHTMMFRLRDPRFLPNAGKGTKVTWFKPTDERGRLVWMYIIGCLNHNLLIDEMIDPQNEYHRRNNNCRNVEEFKITREAEYYMKNKKQKDKRESE